MLSLFISLNAPALGKNETISHEDISVEFEASLEKAAQEIIAIYPALKMELEDLFKWPLNFNPKVILTIARHDFQGFSDSTLVLAYAQPQTHLIVMDYSKMKDNPLRLSATLKHELSHLLLHDQIGMKNLPKWLDEGLSQWASGGMSEILMGGKGDELKQANLRERWIPLSSIKQSFPNEEKKRLLAYAQSKSIVEYIHNTFEISGIRAILAELKAGEEIDVAIQKGISISIGVLEKRWHADLSEKMTGVAFFGDHLVLIIFSMGGLMTVYGFFRLMLQRKRYREKEEEEEILRQLFEDFDQKNNDSFD